jgi:hypothetical protein
MLESNWAYVTTMVLLQSNFPQYQKFDEQSTKQ